MSNSSFASFFARPEIKHQIRDAVINKLSEHHTKQREEAAKEAATIAKAKPISAKQAALPKKKAPDGERFVSKAAKSNRSKQPPVTYLLESFAEFCRPDAHTRRITKAYNDSGMVLKKRLLGSLLEEPIRATDKVLLTESMADRLEEMRILFKYRTKNVGLLSSEAM